MICIAAKNSAFRSISKPAIVIKEHIKNNAARKIFGDLITPKATMIVIKDKMKKTIFITGLESIVVPKIMIYVSTCFLVLFY